MALPATRRRCLLSERLAVEISGGPGGRLETYFPDGDLYGAETRPALRGPVLRPRISSAATVVAEHAVCDDTMIAAGDAAQTRDPLSSAGMEAAMEDAEAAAAALIEALSGDVNALDRHELVRRRRCVDYLRRRNRYYRMEERWRDEPLWRRRREVSYMQTLSAAWAAAMMAPAESRRVDSRSF